MTNAVVEYWTQSGVPFTNSITGERFAAATAGEDYEDIRGTLNFLPMLPYTIRWERIVGYGRGIVVVLVRQKDGLPLSDLPNFIKNDRLPRTNDDFPHPSDLNNTMDYQTTPIRYSSPISYRYVGRYGNYYSDASQRQSIFISIIDDDEPMLAPRVLDQPPPVNVGGGYVFPKFSPEPPPTVEVRPSSSDLMFTSTSLSLEEGEIATYQVHATAYQSRDMVVNLATAHSGITVNPSWLTFYSHNRQDYQTVTVTAASDVRTMASKPRFGIRYRPVLVSLLLTMRGL